MATFLMFGTYSTDATREISRERTGQVVDVIKDLGGTVKNMYAVLGQHDLLLVVELPGIEAALKASVKIADLSGISFTTSSAVEVATFDQLFEAGPKDDSA